MDQIFINYIFGGFALSELMELMDSSIAD